MNFFKISVVLSLSFFLISILTAARSTDHSHDRSVHPSKVMIGIQTGYAWIESKGAHMLTDDSGSIIGLHIMHHKVAKTHSKHCLDERLSWAAGIHKILTEDPHYGMMIGLMYELSPRLTLSFMPGYMFMKHGSHSAMDHSGMGSMGGMTTTMDSVDSKWSSEYASHIELIFSLNAFDQNFKPSISWMTSDSHKLYSIGFNFSF